MLMDTLGEFSDNQLVTATAISTNVIDLTIGQTGLTTIDIGTGEPIYLIIAVEGVVTAAGAATVTFTLESDSTADLATSATVHWTSLVIAKATLVAEYEVVKMRLPTGDYERYLGVRYTVATGPLTVVSSFNAFFVKDIQESPTYQSGFTVS